MTFKANLTMSDLKLNYILKLSTNKQFNQQKMGAIDQSKTLQYRGSLLCLGRCSILSSESLY